MHKLVNARFRRANETTWRWCGYVIERRGADAVTLRYELSRGYRHIGDFASLDSAKFYAYAREAMES